MNLRELKAKGGFVSTTPIAKEVSWEHEVEGKSETDTFTVSVVKQSFGAVEKLFLGPDDRSKSAAFISQCIRFGDEQMTYEDAYQLDPGLAAVLMKAINEVNGTGKVAAKN
jgi:hypothetical protein